MNKDIDEDGGHAMAGELSVISFVAKTLFKVFGLKTEQRKDIAKYLAEIANTLSKFGPAFRQGDHDEVNALAAQAQILADRFADVTKGLLPPEEVRDFVQRLTKAANDKNILAAGSTRNQQQILDEIAQIAGIFRGVSISLEATVNRLA